MTEESRRNLVTRHFHTLSLSHSIHRSTQPYRHLHSSLPPFAIASHPHNTPYHTLKSTPLNLPHHTAAAFLPLRPQNPKPHPGATKPLRPRGLPVRSIIPIRTPNGRP